MSEIKKPKKHWEKYSLNSAASFLANQIKARTMPISPHLKMNTSQTLTDSIAS